MVPKVVHMEELEEYFDGKVFLLMQNVVSSGSLRSRTSNDDKYKVLL